MDSSWWPRSELQPRQVHTITDRFAMTNTYVIVAERLIVIDPCSELNVSLLYRYLERVLHRSPAEIDLVVLTNLHANQSTALAILCRHTYRHVAVAAAVQRLQHSQISRLHASSRTLPSGGSLPAVFERQLRFVDTWLEDMTMLPGAAQWHVIASPGHSPDSLCLYNPFTGELLCGETILAIERHIPVLRDTSDRQQLENFLQCLRSLRVHYMYAGHGRPLLAERPLTHISIEW